MNDLGVPTISRPDTEFFASPRRSTGLSIFKHRRRSFFHFFFSITICRVDTVHFFDHHIHPSPALAIASLLSSRSMEEEFGFLGERRRLKRRTSPRPLLLGAPNHVFVRGGILA